MRSNASRYDADWRTELRTDSTWVKRDPTLLGQGRVLSANKTASTSRERILRSRSALGERAQRLRLIRACAANIPSRQRDRDAYAREVGDLKNRITVRLTDAHAAHLESLARASGLTRNEVMRRLLLNVEIPSARARQEVQDILRIQREQNRLGGLLKKALTERAEKTELRRTLIEVERNGAELRRVLAHLVRSR